MSEFENEVNRLRNMQIDNARIGIVPAFRISKPWWYRILVAICGPN
jgi:hypothetical protein